MTAEWGGIRQGSRRSNTYGALGLQASLRLGRVIVLVAAARFLPVDSFASLAVALALSDLVRAVLVALDVAAVRSLAGGRDPFEIVSDALAAKAALVGILLPVTFLAALAIYDVETAVLALILTLGAYPAGVSATLYAYLQARLGLGPIVAGAALASLAGTVLAVTATATQVVQWVAVALFAGDVVLGLVALLQVRIKWTLRGRAIIDHLRSSPQLMVMQVAYMAQFRLGTLVLATVSTSVAVNEYTIAARLAEGLVVASTAIAATTYPLLAEAIARRAMDALDVDFARGYWASVGIGAALFAALCATSPMWFPFLFPDYAAAVTTFAVISVGVLFFFASGQTTAVLNAAHLDTEAAVSAGSAVVMTTVGGLALAPAGGALGMALARVSGDLVRLVIETARVARSGLLTTGRAWRVWLCALPLGIPIVVGLATGWAAVALLASSTVGLVLAALALGASRSIIAELVSGEWTSRTADK